MEYEKCLVELDEILKYLDLEELNKIPVEIRKVINEKKDKQYKWNYDEAKPLKEQNINRKTIAMLSYLNIKYLLNEEQINLMKELHQFNETKIEKEKLEKYNFNNIFENKKSKCKQYEEAFSIVEYRESFFTKIRNLLRNYLK